jgi:hypothetical protein
MPARQRMHGGWAGRPSDGRVLLLEPIAAVRASTRSCRCRACSYPRFVSAGSIGRTESSAMGTCMLVANRRCVPIAGGRPVAA